MNLPIIQEPLVPSFLDHPRTMIILRGVPGSGKSTLAGLIEILNPGIVQVFSADNYFVDPYDGTYNFRFEDLAKAHCACQNGVMAAAESKVPVIVVDNTNTKPLDFMAYIDIAERFDYRVIRLVCEGCGRESVHGVPQETVNRHRRQLMSTINL